MGQKPYIPITGIQILWGVFSIVGLVVVAWPAAHVQGAAVMLAELRQTWGAATIALDLLFLGVPVVTFVVIEAHRLRMRLPWAWAVLAIPLPGAFLIPLFFLMRERARLRERQEEKR